MFIARRKGESAFGGSAHREIRSHGRAIGVHHENQAVIGQFFGHLSFKNIEIVARKRHVVHRFGSASVETDFLGIGEIPARGHGVL